MAKMTKAEARKVPGPHKMTIAAERRETPSIERKESPKFEKAERLLGIEGRYGKGMKKK